MSPSSAHSTARRLRTARRAAATASLRLTLFAALSLAAAWTPLGQAGAMNDFRDSHLLHSYEEAAVRTVTEHGQLPLWSPWSCGGMYLLGSPQARQSAPTLLLSVLLGARRAEPVLLFLFLLLGMEGAYRYLRLRTGSALAAALGAPVFGLCGFSALSWTLGWLNQLPFLLLPWLLFGTALAARGRVGGAALVAGGFAWMLGFGGAYPVPLCALCVAAEAVRCLLAHRKHPTRTALRPDAVRALVATALLTLGACAFRLWPVWETLQSAPRVMAGSPGNDLLKVLRMVFAFPGAPAGGGDAGILFVGPLVLGVMLAAGLTRRALYPLGAALVAGWLATGYAARPLSAFALLRELPVFSTLRYPERILFPSALFVAELAALGLAVLAARAWGRRPRAAPILLAAAVAMGVGWGVQVAAFAQLSRRAELVPEPPRLEQPFAQARGNRWAQGHVMALERGSISCGEGYPVPMSPALRGDLAQEEALEEADAGSARRVAWTPNRLEVEVDARRPALLRVNQNWHPGWRSSVGEVVSREGLLAVALPEGRHHVTLRFLPRSGLGGLAVSALAWAAWGALAWRSRQGHPGRRPSAGRSRGLGSWGAVALAALPLTAWAALPLLWPEPRALPVLTNPDGSPLTVEVLPLGVPSVEAPQSGVLPSEAREVGARFGRRGEAPPVELVAARVPAHPDREGLVPLELYWRVTGPVPRSVGIFVHVLGPDGARRSADHALVGGTWFLADAPRGVLLRDAFAVSAHDWQMGRWTVHVGLWHAAGDGSRVPAMRSDGRAAAEARVDVGAFTLAPQDAAGP